jgi:FMN phosphatase YigB (HAD superfamily)
MILFRHADPRFPFLWERADQPEARWHRTGEGPVHYFADTPDGAWAEFLRHEEIREPEDLAGIRRALWAIEVSDPGETRPELSEPILLGGFESYAECQAEAARLHALGLTGFRVISAALLPNGARGWIVDGGLREGPSREGQVHILFGLRPDLIGWRTVDEGRPHPDLLGLVRHFLSRPAH